MSAPAGLLSEVFTSIQGEGIFCGARQTFVRFAGCNLRCLYCDTPAAVNVDPAFCSVESEPGSGVFEDIRNPVSAELVAAECERLGAPEVALTGGEPLVQPAFASALMRLLRTRGFRTYLETNGTLAQELESVISLCDVIAMDIKIPSAAGFACWGEHERFLRIASRSNVFVKAVVSDAVTDEEIVRAAQITAAVDPGIPLVIQPVWGEQAPGGPVLMRMQGAALGHLRDVRVIPQCHRVLGVR